MTESIKEKYEREQAEHGLPVANQNAGNVHQIVEGSHHFADIQSIINYIETTVFTLKEEGKFLADALRETQRRGYKISNTHTAPDFSELSEIERLSIKYNVDIRDINNGSSQDE